MTTTDAPALTLAEQALAALAASPHPLKFADILKGLTRPPKVKPAAFKDDVRRTLDEEISQGRAFACPSGKKGETRYWGQDERQLLRDRAAVLASTPMALPALAKALVKEVKGADTAFVEGLLRDLIAEGQLHAHPPKKAGPSLYGRTPFVAPSPFESPPLKKDFDKLVAACRSLATKAGVVGAAVLAALRERFEPTPPPAAPAGPDALILDALRGQPVVSLSDLRRRMPPEHQGTSFDAAVLDLDDQQKVILYSDANPESFTSGELSELVRDGGVVFTTISLRS